MKNSVSKIIEEKLIRFIEKNWEAQWTDPTKIAYLRIGVLFERDFKLENFINIHCGQLPEFGDTTFKSLKIEKLHTHWGVFDVVIDESVDDYYCEFERLKIATDDRLRGMDPPISTLENFGGLRQNRKVGNTTRLADHAIQLILSGKVVQVKDHHCGGLAKESNRRLADIVWKRLNLEHRGLPFRYDMTNLIIEIQK